MLGTAGEVNTNSFMTFSNGLIHMDQQERMGREIQGNLCCQPTLMMMMMMMPKSFMVFNYIQHKNLSSQPFHT